MRRVRDAVYFFFVFTFPVVAAVVAWRLAATSTRTMATKPSNHNLNVFKKPLGLFSQKPMTGFYRDGYCRVGPEDKGNHAIAAVVTDEFLDFSASRGNDLRQIPGMKGGCKWCLCTNRWKEAVDARKSDDDPVVPKVFLHATDESALGNGITMDTLKKFAAESEVDAGGSGGGPTPRTAIPLTPGVSPGVKETH